MRYSVILDASSIIGSIYSSGSNDGYVRTGETKHPILDCLEVDFSSPYYLFVKRDLSKHNKTYQKIHIPHSNIVSVYSYADEESKPMGFVSN